jgi:hypothetical protein
MIRRVFAWVREPWAINAAQIAQFTLAMFFGFMAVLGTATPTFISSTIGPKLIAAVGILWIIGGAVGTYSVARGNWGWERVALWITGIAFVMLLPAATYYSFRGKNPAIWIVLGLVVWALLDIFKRYRRIDWAYLDPTK